MDYVKLVAFYRAYNHVKSALTDGELFAYFMALDHRKNLIVETDSNGDILGFCEHWRINYEQLGRLLVHGLIDAREEDTTSGNIAFVANVAVHPDHPGEGIFESMKVKYFMANFNCAFFAGDSRRKKHHHTWDVYKRTELISKYLKPQGV